MTVRIAANYTPWKTEELQAWIDTWLARGEEAHQTYYRTWTHTPPSSFSRRPVKLLVFDWSTGCSAKWAKVDSDLDYVDPAATELTFELLLAPPARLSESPMQTLSTTLSQSFTLEEEHYQQLQDRLYMLLCREYPLMATLVNTTEIFERKDRQVSINSDFNFSKAEEGKKVRTEFRKAVLVSQTSQEIERVGRRYYDRYMKQMANRFEKLRASHRKEGFPVEVLESLKDQLRQDLNWLDSITSQVKKIQRPDTRFKR